MIQNLTSEFVVTRPTIALEVNTAFMYGNKELVDILVNGYNYKQVNQETVNIVADEIEIIEEETVEEEIPNFLTEAQNLGLFEINEEESIVLEYMDRITTSDYNYIIFY